MLILSNPPPIGWAVPNAASLASYIREHAIERVNEMNNLCKKEKEVLIPKIEAEIRKEPIPIRATLIVLPQTLLNQWQDEVKAHVKEGELRVGLFDSDSALILYHHSSSEAVDAQLPTIPTCLVPSAVLKRQAQRLALTAATRKVGKRETVYLNALEDRMPLTDLDICFMSYEQMRNAIKTRDSVLTRFGFWRIMLDEAQLVAQSNSVAAVVASSLWRRHAWVVTGTPISSSVDELRGLCEFLSLEPYYHPKAWNQLVRNPYQSRSLSGLLTMRGLVRGVMLRRTKGDVQDQMTELPPCVQEDCIVTLSSIERVAYEQIRRKYRDQITAMKRNLQIHQNNIARGIEAREIKRHNTNAVAWLTALRQTCCHPQIVKADSVGGQGGKDQRVVSTMREIMTRLVTKAFSELDAAAGDLISSQVKTAAIKLYLSLATATDADSGGLSSSPDPNVAAHIMEEIRAEVSSHVNLFKKKEKGIRWVSKQRDREGHLVGAAGGSNGAESMDEGKEGEEEGEEDDIFRDCERRWVRISLEVEVLFAYVLRKCFPPDAPTDGPPPDGPAANGLEGGGAGPSSPRDGDGKKRKRQDTPNLPDMREEDKEDLTRSSKASKVHEHQGPSSSHAAVGPPGSPLALPSPQVKAWAAKTLSTVKEAEVSFRLLLGFPPISFLDEIDERLANMRRSRRNEGDQTGAGVGVGAGWGAGAGAASSAPMAIEDLIVPRDEKEEEDERASRGARVARRAAAAAAARSSGRRADDEDYDEEDDDDEEELESDDSSSDDESEDVRGRGKTSKKQKSKKEPKVKVPLTGEERVMRSEVVIRSLALLLDKKDSIKTSLVHEAQSLKGYQKSFSNLMHLLSQEEEQLMEEAKVREKEKEGEVKGEKRDHAMDTDTAPSASTSAAAQGGKAEAVLTCPICLDRPEKKTITSCGHSYCTDCIWEIINSNKSNCPICRQPLTAANLFDSISEEDAAKAEEAQRLSKMANHEFGEWLIARMSSYFNSHFYPLRCKGLDASLKDL